MSGRVWHAAYCRWYDHDRTGNTIRARAWGFIADTLARIAREEASRG